jgi:hypothetical protein
MAFLGVLLMIQGFGGLIADYFFDKSFGLLHLCFEGGTLTAASTVVGLLGLVVTVLSVRAEERS